MDLNLLFDTDSYKVSHWLQYPADTTAIGAYLESRGGDCSHTLFFGLQYLLLRYFFQPITSADIQEAAALFQAHGLPFNQAGWQRVCDRYGGYLPLRIRAVPEGSLVPTGNILLTVESTDPELAWLATWVETLLLRVWYPITVATRSWQLRQIIQQALEQSAENPAAEIDFKLHDFGSRGVSSQESAAIGGLAHLVNFQGTDTIAALLAGQRYYDCAIAGFSIPAAEHSTITAWGPSGELDAYRNMLDRFANPGSVVAVVSDSYDLWHAVDQLWGEDLRDRILQSGATVVIRPDSGNPEQIVPELLRRLAAKFGCDRNQKGYQVLRSVRVIQGDGITVDSLPKVLQAVMAAGFSASNVAFGMGGGLLQQVNRDTQRFAYKCSWIERSGQVIPICKRPATDLRKASKAGRLDLIRDREGQYRTVSLLTSEPDPQSCLQTVFENGAIVRRQSLQEIRDRARSETR
ncbi:nicotinate phosphoribosyltransferase [Synechococcus elongatus]|uniref:Nicotinamide phosphoribosyltransferase n=2 Tax=Synechococcus elongatus TaxID=32046 RepID=Q31RT1_SYNE7|nr:nicotinate phosphoribosyltransferase [Synechococcus elongatus]ABB56238.1 Nicotinic acid phosphoribosyltransferase-like [Synechococcus elongatus PCC 7942 = FACHB-805]MBD2588070.1 nicotinate phosphoribosyltransferase [Synechococcus elongatus FACHB-242]MBD2689138.1 nicotinate phosphoribosyltransferase [Synechococcus elongatus FACHB-1061]MBD2707222.1 nicotinate phosphoribosyltransferase [Synechococcus elongatus PCC 7942 = FACHB-805]UOW69988.1 nicotinamide phosphoribosyltransferase [Synechococcu